MANEQAPKIVTRESAALEEKLDAALALIRAEALRAMTKHAPMNSSHEAFGVIFEEFNVEFVAEMVANNADKQEIEMVQVGAMAARALVDVYKVGPQPVLMERDLSEQESFIVEAAMQMGFELDRRGDDDGNDFNVRSEKIVDFAKAIAKHTIEQFVSAYPDRTCAAALELYDAGK